MSQVDATIHTRQVNEHTASVTVTGRLDAGNAEIMKETLMQLIDGGAIHLIVDLADVPFIDSAGLAALVSALKATRRLGGNVVLSGVQPQARTVFSLTMLDQVFTIYPSLGDAVDSLEANAQ